MTEEIKPMILIFNEMMKNGNDPDMQNLKDCYIYMGDAAVNGTDLLRNFIPNGQAKGPEFRRFLISGILGFMVNTSTYAPLMQEIIMISQSDTLTDILLLAFCAGVGAGAREEIR